MFVLSQFHFQVKKEVTNNKLAMHIMDIYN